MKRVLLCLLACVMAIQALAAPSAQQVVKTCQLGNRPMHAIQVAREQEIAASHIYTLRYGKTSQYFFESRDTSRGLSVHIACAGKKQHALVAYGEFTSNFLQGFVIARSPQSGKLHRLDFAERSPPQWRYIGNDETLVIMPTNGIGEYGARKYIVYRRANSDGAETGVSGSMSCHPQPASRLRNCQGKSANEICELPTHPASPHRSL